MHKQLLRAWLIGLAVFATLFAAGTILNFNKQTVSKPHCDNQEFVTYIGCDLRADSVQYYAVGWPQKVYCYFDGKHSCSPWDDFLYAPRAAQKSDVLKQNALLISLGSLCIGLLVTSIVLSKNQYRKK